ncbi:MAG: decarboxylase [Betaproteobacteria bacterium]|jgi:malonyl-CoA decarboxylase|nr:decarboxylase [Betaproteobacteria bacterium]
MILTNLFQRSGKAHSAAAVKELQQLCYRLLSEAGTANSAAIAEQLVRAYSALPPEARLAFFNFLDSALAPDRERVLRAAKAYSEKQDAQTVLELQRVVEPPRQELLRRINRAPGGTAAIIAMRRDLLQALSQLPHLRAVDSDFRHLLGSWFNPGFLILQQVDWSSPAALLEKIIQHEAVHAVKDWNDLRRRVQSDRRCFAFFHPQLPGEPLIFVEVALVNAIPRLIEQLIGDSAPGEASREPRVAVFYSISNCEPGLRGVSLGNFLIKRVAQQLRAEIPTLKRYCTLSPIPGLRAWLTKVDPQTLPETWTPRLRGRFATALKALRSRHGNDFESLAQAARDRALAREDQLRLEQCAAVFLARESVLPQGDPVARFHLDNGARLERVNINADLSPKGLRESLGVMVNYLYDLAAIEANHERFIRGEVVSSRQIAKIS